jgi:serine/threonine protein kinase
MNAGKGDGLKRDWKNSILSFAGVQSAHVVRVVDAFEDQGDCYIVMEYCTKGTVRDLLRQHKDDGVILSEAVYSLLLTILHRLMFFCWMFLLGNLFICSTVD